MKPLTIKVTDKRIKDLQDICKSDTLYIWGGGSYSDIIKEYLRLEGGFTGKLINIVDDEFFKSRDTDTIPLSNVIADGKKDSPVVFGFYNYPIVNMKKQKWSEFFRMYDFHFAVVNGKRLRWDAKTAKYLEAEYQKTYELLSDERSRRVMQLYLNAATAGEFHELFTECYEPTAYFNRITDGVPVDTLIDCGAYDGDSIHDFISAFPNYKSIVAIEPDPSNLNKLADRKEREHIRDLKVINKGVGAKSGVLHFQAKGESNSFLDDSGDCEIQIITLDEIRSKITGNVLLKMDIEGSELDALHGAEKLIREKHPILTVCVYHKEEDLIEIPQFIHQTVGNGVYDYYLGFHGLDLAELVFYAVPKALKNGSRSK